MSQSTKYSEERLGGLSTKPDTTSREEQISISDLRSRISASDRLYRETFEKARQNPSLEMVIILRAMYKSLTEDEEELRRREAQDSSSRQQTVLPTAEDI